MTKRKFYKTVVKLEILSEAPLTQCENLCDIAHEIIEGDYSGEVSTESVTKLSGKQTAKALQAQGSDPEFFNLDENGNDLED